MFGSSLGFFALLFVNLVASREDFLPLPTTPEWGEDRGEGQFIRFTRKAPPLPGPLLHCAEEKESLRLRLRRAVNCPV
jgi:hypothetical protein